MTNPKIATVVILFLAIGYATLAAVFYQGVYTPVMQHITASKSDAYHVKLRVWDETKQEYK